MREHIYEGMGGGAEGDRESQVDSPLSAEPHAGGAQSQSPKITTRARTEKWTLT